VPRPSIHRRLRARAGVALFEMLMAIAISAGLLTATAFALDASIKAFRINQEQAILLQNTRLAMHRILATVRRCKLHAPDDATLRTQFAAGRTVTGSGVVMLDTDDVQTTYRYDPATKTVLLIGPDGKSHSLIHGVEEFAITLEPMRSHSALRTGAGWDLLRRATVQITVKTTDQTAMAGEVSGKTSLTLSGSVMPRRNAW
jgi:Tfp pilus assembly protein PilE